MTVKLSKPVLKWVKRLSIGVISFFVLLMVLVSIPAVQTFLGQYAANKINEKYGTNIVIGQLSANIKGEVVLKDILILDHLEETLMSVNRLNTSILNVKSIINSDLRFGSVEIDGLLLNMRTYKGEVLSNLDYFVEQLSASSKPDNSSTFKLAAKKIHCSNALYSIVDENRDVHLDFQKLTVFATNLLIEGPNVSMNIDHLGFSMPNGIEVSNLTSKFIYTLSFMKFKDLSVQTPFSDLTGQLRFDYKREDLKFFNDKVKLKANLNDMALSTNDLGLFYKSFGRDIVFNGRMDLSGTLNQLEIHDMNIVFDQNASLKSEFELSDLFNSSKAYKIKGNVEQLNFDQGSISRLLPQLLDANASKVFKKLDFLEASGTIEITQTDIDADLNLRTKLGNINPNLAYNADKHTLAGGLQFSSLNLGALFNLEGLGSTSGQVDLQLAHFDSKNITAQIEGDLTELTIGEYTYRNTSFVGEMLSCNEFGGQFRFRDDHLTANFDGSISGLTNQKQFNFAAHILEADLKAIKLAKSEKESIFSGHMLIQAEGTNVDDALGIASFYDIAYRNQDGKYSFENFDITASMDGDNRLLRVNSPEIITGQIKGQFKLSELNKLAHNSMTHIYNLGDEYEVSPNQSLDFDFVVYNKIAKIMSTYLNIGDNGKLSGHMASDSQEFKANVLAPFFSTKDVIIEEMTMELDNKNPVYNTFVEIGSLKTSFFQARDFNLINVTRKDTLFIKTNFKGPINSTDRYDFNLYYTKDQSKSVVGLKRSVINFQNVPWVLNPNKDNNHKIVFDRSFKDVQVYPTLMTHDNELIQMSGELFSTTDKPFDLKFQEVVLEHVLPEIDKFKMSGIINGILSLTQDNNQIKPTADIVIDNYHLNGFALGDFTAQISGKTPTEYDLKAILSNSFSETIMVQGGLNFGENGQNLDLILQLNNAILDPLTPAGGEVISDIRGQVSGIVTISGKFDQPSYDGKLYLENAGLKVPYLNVDYNFGNDTTLQLSKQTFELNNLELVDSSFGTKTNMKGKIKHSNFANWILDLDISSPRMLVLNTTNDKEPLYFGKAFVGGNIGIKGQAEALVIKAEVLTKKGTTFVIPLNDTQILSNSDYLTFITSEEKYNTLGVDFTSTKTYSGLELDFDLEIDENADIEIIMDPKTRSGIRGSGNGGLLVQINTNGKFNIYGDFIVAKGVYNYIYEPIIRKEFKVRPGGTLVWNGEPTKAEINLTAVYSQLQANPSILLDNPINRSIPVEVEIQLSGQLERPEPNFELRFPSVNSALNSELGYRLNDNESKQFQALSLLATGAFTNQLKLDEQAVYGNLVERFSDAVNSAISGGNDAIQLGLDYQIGRKTQDYITENRVGFSLAGKISDRVLFNGKVGVPFGGVNETVVAGNFEIQVLLNEERTLTLNIFNKENDIQNFGEAIFFTQGVGLSYDVEFDSLKELLRKIFNPDASNSEATKEEEIQEESSPLKGFMSFKKQQQPLNRK